MPDETAFGSATKYRAHLDLIEYLHWSLNPKILPDLTDNIFGFPHVQNKGYQTNHMQVVSVPGTAINNTTECVCTDQ